MNETRPSGTELVTTHLADVDPEPVLGRGFSVLRAVLSWALPATAMLAGG